MSPVASNRLVVEADDNGDICFYTLGQAQLVVDVNGVSDTGIVSFPNQRTDTRTASAPPATGAEMVDGVPVWPPYSPLAAARGCRRAHRAAGRHDRHPATGAGGEDRQLRRRRGRNGASTRPTPCWRSTSRA